MVKTLTKHGNSYALVIDRPIMDLLKFEPDSALEVTTDGTSLRISLATPGSRGERMQRAIKKVNEKYAKAFKKLAE